MGGGNVWIGGERTNINLDTIGIDVGSSRHYHIKNITLDDDDMEVSPKPTNSQKRGWRDRFKTTVVGKTLSVERLDKRSGWGQNLQLQGHVKYSGTTSTYWKWADNSKWDYTNFKDNEPNTKTETKLQIQQTGKWNDAPPDTKIGAVYAL